MGCKASKLNIKSSNFDNTELFTFDGIKTNAKVVKVYDGDTLWIVFNYYKRLIKIKVRMLGYDSPEIRPPKNLINRQNEIYRAHKAKEYIESLVLNKVVKVHLSKFDKYGRPLCTIYIPDPDKKFIPCPNELCVNTLMVRNNHGVTYMGGTK